MAISVGVGGARRNACVALRSDERLVGVCEQERVTRVRGAGVNESGLPDEALDALLGRAKLRRDAIARVAVGESMPALTGFDVVRLEHHFAHACAAFLPSSFDTAAIVVCDHHPPQVSVWQGRDRDIVRLDWPWEGPGFSALYSTCAATLGFPRGTEQRLEALARLGPARPGEPLRGLFGYDKDRLRLEPEWQGRVADWLQSIGSGAGGPQRSAGAAGLQSRIGDLLIDFLEDLRRRLDPVIDRLCVGGSLFNNSYFNARVKGSRLFSDVFVPVNPGNAGLALGTALHVGGRTPAAKSAFLGPTYDSEEIKATLDNCKLSYQWLSEKQVISRTIDTLSHGGMVGWFDGAMEWGPRALGGRSILANPFAPYVLENLNRFLKQREPWRGYALSGLEACIHELFDGPASSPFMECDYTPRDRDLMRHILPGTNAAIRIQTVGDDQPRRFRALLQAFGERAGHPLLVNTSFNGFLEPMVCSPRDAVRVFFGTGLDMLVIDRFVLCK